MFKKNCPDSSVIYRATSCFPKLITGISGSAAGPLRYRRGNNAHGIEPVYEGEKTHYQVCGGQTRLSTWGDKPVCLVGGRQTRLSNYRGRDPFRVTSSKAARTTLFLLASLGASCRNQASRPKFARVSRPAPHSRDRRRCAADRTYLCVATTQHVYAHYRLARRVASIGLSTTIIVRSRQNVS